MTNDELLASIRTERARLDELVARVGEARMEDPVLEGGRSVKDVLAHISAWEKIGMALVRNNQPLQPPPPGESGQASTDAINDRVFEDNRIRSLDEIVAEASRSYAGLLALTEEMSDEAIDAVLGAGQEGAGQSPQVREIISGNSDAHYREHAEQIERWLDRT
jgi:hypothetical protein